MAATFAKVSNGENVNGKWREQLIDFTPDTSAQAGGYTLSPQICGMKTILSVSTVSNNTAAISYSSKYNSTTGKQTIYNGTSELTGDQHTLTFRLLVRGY